MQTKKHYQYMLSTYTKGYLEIMQKRSISHTNKDIN